jgi:acetylornithine deacetylase
LSALEAALAAVDRAAIVRDAAALIRVPSVTGDERAVLRAFAGLATDLGLVASVREHDLAALRAHPSHPGEEAERTELLGAVATLSGDRSRGRLCLNGHVDVVGPGTEPWRHGPWSGVVEDGWLHGRGSVDMKGALVAALHAMAAVRAAGAPAPEVVLLGVASEEDGGLGTFAALEEDAAFDAALIPEPTGFATVCAQAGALTFRGTVSGRSTHAAVRLEGCSAIDRYVRVHAALAEHERTVNADVAHPAMRSLALPYPLLVGRVAAGQWSSQVPDRLVFEGRLGVRVEETPEQARAAFERVVAEASDDGEAPVEIHWTGGQFAPAQLAPDHPFTQLVRAAFSAERGGDTGVAGVPWGADMRHFRAKGIPCVMAGPPGIEFAHAVDERVRVDDLVTVARALVRVIVGHPSTVM